MMNLTLNNEIQLMSNVDQFSQCGGVEIICDEYMYFCVADNTLYFNHESTLVQNGEIHIELRRLKRHAFIAGLVLLKGSLGEERKLMSSAKNERMHFDPTKTHSKCLALTKTEVNNPIELQKNMKTMLEDHLKNFTYTFEASKSSCENVLVVLNEKTQEEFKILQEQQNKSKNQNEENIKRFTDNNLEKISNLKAIIQSSIENTQVAIIREIQSLKKQQNGNSNRLEKVEQQINESVSGFVQKF
jgi:hypothetical protein